MAINYVSTRGIAPYMDFEGVLLAGLASDGGLYVPSELPQFSHEEIRDMRDLAYPNLAFKILEPFVRISVILGGGFGFSCVQHVEIKNTGSGQLAHSWFAPVAEGFEFLRVKFRTLWRGRDSRA